MRPKYRRHTDIYGVVPEDFLRKLFTLFTICPGKYGEKRLLTTDCTDQHGFLNRRERRDNEASSLNRQVCREQV